jgi:hypothetical protein
VAEIVILIAQAFAEIFVSGPSQFPCFQQNSSYTNHGQERYKIQRIIGDKFDQGECSLQIIES